MAISMDVLKTICHNYSWIFGYNVAVRLSLWHFNPISQKGASDNIHVDFLHTGPVGLDYTNRSIQHEDRDLDVRYWLPPTTLTSPEKLHALIESHITDFNKKFPNNVREWGIGSGILASSKNLTNSEKGVLSDRLFEEGHYNPEDPHRHISMVDFKTNDEEFLTKSLQLTDLQITILKTQNSFHGYGISHALGINDWYGKLIQWDVNAGGGLIDLRWVAYALQRGEGVLRITDHTKALPAFWKRPANKLPIPY